MQRGRSVFGECEQCSTTKYSRVLKGEQVVGDDEAGKCLMLRAQALKLDSSLLAFKM